MDFLKNLTSWDGSRSDTGRYCEYEENELAVDVHAQRLEREEMKGTDSYPAIPQTTLLISCFVSADTVPCCGGGFHFSVSERDGRCLNIYVQVWTAQRMTHNFSGGTLGCALRCLIGSRYVTRSSIYYKDFLMHGEIRS